MTKEFQMILQALLNKATEDGLQCIVQFNDDESKCVGLTSNLQSDIPNITKDYLLNLGIKFMNALVDLTALSFDGTIPNSMRNILSIFYVMSKGYSEMLNDPKSKINMYRKFIEGNYEGIPKDILDQFKSNGWNETNDPDLKPELKSLNDMDKSLN